MCRRYTRLCDDKESALESLCVLECVGRISTCPNRPLETYLCDESLSETPILAGVRGQVLFTLDTVRFESRWLRVDDGQSARPPRAETLCSCESLRLEEDLCVLSRASVSRERERERESVAGQIGNRAPGPRRADGSLGLPRAAPRPQRKRESPTHAGRVETQCDHAIS